MRAEFLQSGPYSNVPYVASIFHVRSNLNMRSTHDTLYKAGKATNLRYPSPSCI